MARYIDAEFVSDGLREVLHKPKSEFPDDFEKAIDCLVYAISILKFAPTADVAPVVHAHWVRWREPNVTKSVYKCSNCGFDITVDEAPNIDIGFWIEDFKYCLHCGAKMDEMDEEV